MVKSKHLTLIIFFLSFIKISYSQSWHTYFGDTIWNGSLVIESIHIDEDSFIIGGAFQNIGNKPIKGVAKFNNYQWSGFQQTYSNSGYPSCLTTYKNKLYAGSRNAGWNPNGNTSTANFSVWDGNQWLPPNPPIGGFIFSLKVINDSLFALGSCEFGAKVLVTDGNTWEYLENIEANYAASIIEYNDELLVGTNYGLWKRVGYDTWQQF
ncbi:MAG: hypothetical protein QM212_00045, partial [Bacteroidota bacterium]|nr:hypothetical protein [Bacteroidota bacterium]